MLAKALASASASAAKVYVEDVFSTWLYTGNGSTQTITNGIDLAGEGGLVWIKGRASAYSHALFDTARGAQNALRTDLTNPVLTVANSLTSFDSTGFSLGTDSTNGFVNWPSQTYASWTFRKAEKFFDVVTYTGDGTGTKLINHNLGTTPRFIIIKRTNSTGNWFVSAKVDDAPNAQQELLLNSTAAAYTGNIALSSHATSSTIKVGDSQWSAASNGTNINGATYVAYLFAHDAGGFGDSGNDSVVSCGSATGGGTVTLGWEPQWILFKGSDTSTDWYIVDAIRGMPVGSNEAWLKPNLSDAEGSNNVVEISSTGFSLPSAFWGSISGIYIAIRRGPMKTPTDAMTVFGLSARTGTGANATVTGGQVDDAVLIKNRGSAVASLFSSRLTGTRYLITSSTAAEAAAGATILQANPWDVMNGVKVGTTSQITNANSSTFINYLFRRAPGFFDVVAYTGTGSATTVSHNLGVAPELMIVKRRNAAAESWLVYAAPVTATQALFLEDPSPAATLSVWNNTAPTASVFSVSTTSGAVNASGGTYIAYLFATLTGVSKVGSYTGTGTTLNIDCGFTNGARFVLIKRTDSTGDWYVWDTARGIVSGNDPYLLLNSTAAEVTNTDYIDPLSSGFQISSTAPAAINANGGSFIFLAVA